MGLYDRAEKKGAVTWQKNLSPSLPCGGEDIGYGFGWESAPWWLP
jgi:hypothetical protein